MSSCKIVYYAASIVVACIVLSAAGCSTGAGPATLPGRNQLVTTPTVSVVKVKQVPTFTLAAPAEPAAIEKATATEERVEVPELRLTVEEYPIVATGGYTPDRLEYMRLISPTILARRQAWRNLPPDKVVESTNQILVKFGYRLEHNPIKSSYEYRLYQGDTLVQDQIYGFRYVTVNQRGDDFALPLQTKTDGNVLVRRDQIEPRIPGPMTYMPIFWGNELLTVHTDRSQVLVQQGDKAIYTIPVEFAVADPVKGLWAWEGHWVLEVDGQVIVDGKSLNEEQGYDEIFGWRPLNGQPFYFFKTGDRIRVSYADEVLPYQYEEVIHYRCCGPAAFNVGNSEVMVWFHALKNGMWYYVEMGIYANGD
jgi:hypothetical protein